MFFLLQSPSNHSPSLHLLSLHLLSLYPRLLLLRERRTTRPDMQTDQRRMQWSARSERLRRKLQVLCRRRRQVFEERRYRALPVRCRIIQIWDNLRDDGHFDVSRWTGIFVC